MKYTCACDPRQKTPHVVRSSAVKSFDFLMPFFATEHRAYNGRSGGLLIKDKLVWYFFSFGMFVIVTSPRVTCDKKDYFLPWYKRFYVLFWKPRIRKILLNKNFKKEKHDIYG